MRRCRPRGGEKAHVEVKNIKNRRGSSFVDIQMSFRVAGARDCEPCQGDAKLEGLVALSTLRYTSYIALRYTTFHYTTRHYIRLHSAPLHYTSYNYNYVYNYKIDKCTNVHEPTQHQLHYITLHFTVPGT